MRTDAVEEMQVEELRAGADTFRADGFSLLKITRDGVEKRLRLPIRSRGVAETLELAAEGEPRPPVHREWVRASSELGRQAGLTRDGFVMVADPTDEQYLKARREHDLEVGLRLVAQGAAVPFRDAQGRPVEEAGEKVRLLGEMGLRREHFTQLAADIRDLTRVCGEAEENF